MKLSKFGTKNALTLKNYCHIWDQHLRICITAKFCAKTKMTTFGTKIPYLGVFGQ